MRFSSKVILSKIYFCNKILVEASRFHHSRIFATKTPNPRTYLSLVDWLPLYSNLLFGNNKTFYMVFISNLLKNHRIKEHQLKSRLSNPHFLKKVGVGNVDHVSKCFFFKYGKYRISVYFKCGHFSTWYRRISGKQCRLLFL